MGRSAVVEERFIVVRDQSKRAKVCRGRHGGGYTLVAVCEPNSTPSAEQMVELLNGSEELRKVVPNG